MRLCGGFLRREQLSCPKKRHETDATARESVRSALLAVDARRPRFGTPGRLRGGRRRPRATAPPEVTTSSTRQTRSPGSKTPSSRFAVPYSFAALRTIRNGSPDESDAAAASATAPSSGPASRSASGSCSATVAAMRSPSAREQLGPRLEAVLVEVVVRAPARAQDEVALEVGVLAERGAELVVASRAPRPRSASRAMGEQRRRLGRVAVRARPSSRPRSRGRPARGPRGSRRRVEADAEQRRRRRTRARGAYDVPLLFGRVVRGFGLAFGFGFGFGGFAASASRRLGDGSQAALQVVEDEPDRRLRPRSSRRSSRSPSRTTKTLPVAASRPRAARARPRAERAPACVEQRLSRSRRTRSARSVGERRRRRPCRPRRTGPRPRSATRSRSARRAPASGVHRG